MVTIKKDFNLRFNPKTIMHLIDCSEDSPVYSEMLEEFYDLSEKSIAHIKPIALMSYGRITSYNVCYTKLLRIKPHFLTYLLHNFADFNKLSAFD